MIREIAFDTETTGLRPEEGHRIVELGCIELINHVPTGRTLHHYYDPERLMDPDATRVSGITDEMVRGKPKFAELAQSFLDFIGDATLVAHNASFDMGFVNAELKRAGFETLLPERAIDTLLIARRKFPGAPASLDALCKRFNVDLSERVKHGALLDAGLLAQVYLELCGGRQPGLVLAVETEIQIAATSETRRLPRPEPLPSRLTAAEEAAHAAFIATLKGEAIWKQYQA
ncbi:DNA polymerase III subunit epsilon [Alphaproteobacteria bacterium SO-S41]|nr:DNA polymerase III subunit epsilon [Alphaproteobacteria bacterium SO-S41]